MEENRDAIMKIPGVQGVGVGLSPTQPGQHCILVYLTGNNWPATLPKEIEGYRVEIVETKGFHAL